MPHILTALFKDRAKARQGLQSLVEMGIARDRVTAIGLNEGREVSLISGFRIRDAMDESQTAPHDLDLPESDLRLFEERLRQGCALIAARVDREKLDEAIRVLEMFDPVDLDRESREWADASGSRQGGADAGGPLGAGITGGNAEGMSNTAAAPGMGTMTGDGTSLGTADLRTDETARPPGGVGSTVTTGQVNRGGREDRPGVNELRQPSAAPEPGRGPFQRELNRRGPIWSYRTE